jgi:hypothetical protein
MGLKKGIVPPSVELHHLTGIPTNAAQTVGFHGVSHLATCMEPTQDTQILLFALIAREMYMLFTRINHLAMAKYMGVFRMIAVQVSGQ